MRIKSNEATDNASKEAIVMPGTAIKWQRRGKTSKSNNESWVFNVSKCQQERMTSMAIWKS